MRSKPVPSMRNMRQLIVGVTFLGLVACQPGDAEMARAPQPAASAPPATIAATTAPTEAITEVVTETSVVSSTAPVVTPTVVTPTVVVTAATDLTVTQQAITQEVVTEEAVSEEVVTEEAVSTQPEPAMPHAEMVSIATADLAQRLGIPEDQITTRIKVLEVREVTWPDTSLGCPQPDQMYAQVEQAGLLIRLGVDGKMYFYHSGGDQEPFLCEQSSEMVPQSTPKFEEFVPPPDSEID